MLGAAALKNRPQIAEIIVTERDRRAVGGRRSGAYAIVAELIVDDQVALRHHMRDDRLISEKTAYERQAGIKAQKTGNAAFELAMRAPFAAHQTRALGAHAPGANGTDRRHFDAGVLSEAQIVVIGETDELAAPLRGLVPQRVQ